MEVDREKMITFLDRAAALPIHEIIFASARPFPTLEYNCYLHPYPRGFWVLSGVKHVGIARRGQIEQQFIEPGTMIFGHDGAWVKEFWDSAHEMICLIYFKEMIRTLYIRHNGRPPEQNGPDVYFNTGRPLATPGDYVLKGLMTLGGKVGLATPAGAPELAAALLQLTRQELTEQTANPQGKSLFTWNCIKNYLEENLAADLSREVVAIKFKIHPSHLSRLARRHTGIGFNEYVARERMEHAAMLLRQGSLTVDETAACCGFKYTSYFIRVFERHFQLSPNTYRERQGTGEASLVPRRR